MATTINCVRSCSWAKVLLVLLWCAQLVSAGEPNAACKTMPSMGKDDNDEKCCEMPEIFPNETLHQCMEDFERSSVSQLQKSCQFSACVLKKHNLVKSDGKLDTDQIKSYIKDQIKTSDEWKGLIEKAVLEDCLPMIEKDSTIVKQMKSSLGDCEPTSALAIACAVAKLFGNCPSKDWTGSPVCDEWRTFLTKCSGSMDDLNAIYMLIESQKLT